MEQRLSIITLGVTDIEKSRFFYNRLGWQEAAASNEHIAFFQLNSFVFALYPKDLLAKDTNQVPSKNNSLPSFTLAYNVCSEQEVIDTLSFAKKVGAKIIKPAEKAFWGGFSGYFADEDGHLWEVAHNPFAKLDEYGNFFISK